MVEVILPLLHLLPGLLALLLSLRGGEVQEALGQLLADAGQQEEVPAAHGFDTRQQELRLEKIIC